MATTHGKLKKDLSTAGEKNYLFFWIFVLIFLPASVVLVVFLSIFRGNDLLSLTILLLFGGFVAFMHMYARSKGVNLLAPSPDKEKEKVLYHLLQGLPDDHHVFRDVVMENGENFDILVVCPKGVFSIKVYKKEEEKEEGEDHPSIPLPWSGKQAVDKAQHLQKIMKEKLEEEHFVFPVLVLPSKEIDIETGGYSRKEGTVYILTPNKLLTFLKITNFDKYIPSKVEQLVRLFRSEDRNKGSGEQ
jgi:hypothetical protein